MLKYKRKLESLKEFTITNEPSKATQSAYTTRIGSISVDEMMRVTTKYENGRVPETSIASICSVTCILPNSAPILEPNLPAQINPVINGPSERTTACETKEGNQDSAPKEARDGCDCFVNTTPARKEVKVTKNNDLLPCAKHWFMISLHSYGGVKAFLKKAAMNL